MSGFQTEQFKGTDRFDVERRIGSGGMGVVYRAFDRQRRETVAIKTLRNVEPAAIYRLKREFRAIADLVHPNFVKLYELFFSAGEWFFTMEFVEGADFLQYVRFGEPGIPADGHPRSESTNALYATDGAIQPETANARDRLDETVVLLPPDTPHRRMEGLSSTFSPANAARLRTALHQLAVGLCALHDAGKLHRDLKPSNVLVTPGGRVVLLDFGLATEVKRKEIDVTSKSHVLGTAPYMSPEQAAAKELTPASDWYSVGVMVYEALTGRCPFLGQSIQVLLDKQQHDPSQPAELVPEIPADLNALCVELLRRDPATRPGGAEVIRRSAAMAAVPTESTVKEASTKQTAVFVGRTEYLSSLANALTSAKHQGTAVVHVHGRSGVGKSALVERFLISIRSDDETVVLAGRCHERESVPFRALDSLMDALTRYLLRLSSLEVDALMPRDIVALACVFPVLRRVRAIDHVCEHGRQVPNRQELRQRAFAALRELFARLGDRKTLVLCIDDLQWGDLDSVALLDELLQPPDPPRLLLLLCYRSEEKAINPVLRAVLDAQFIQGADIDSRFLEVRPLTEIESRELALTLIGSADSSAKQLSEVIARESGGNPYFIDALVRYQQTGHDVPARPAKTKPIGLDEMLWDRARRLPENARRLLEVIAVAGRPLQEADACQAAELSVEARDVLAVLRSNSMIRLAGGERGDEVETYHDRIRESVVAHLPQETLKRHHRRLARALESSGEADPAVLAGHFLRAGDPGRAKANFTDAADLAAAALAFDRAAELYRQAVELCGRDTMEERSLLRKLADALSNAGRGAEAAREYLAVAAESTDAESLELRRCAAMQSLISGHIDDGLAELRTVLKAAGLKYATTSRRAFWSLVIHRARIWLRGLRFRLRDPRQVSAEELTKVDICWSAGIGLGVVDVIRGADFQARGLLLALRSGDPFRVARAVTVEAGHVSTGGIRAQRRWQRLAREARRLVEQVDHPYTTGLLSCVDGIAACLQGRWRASISACDEADRIFRDHSTGAIWEHDTAHVFALWSLYWSGQIGELARRLPILLVEARRRGDLYALANLGTFSGPTVTLAADDPDKAEQELRGIMAMWSRQGCHVQHLHELYGQVLIELYRGDGVAAWDHMTRRYPALKRSLLLHVQLLRMMIHDARARCALTAAAGTVAREPLLRAAERDARGLAKEPMSWGASAACMIRAGIAACRGDREGPVALIQEAIRGFERADMGLFAATARRRLGELLGGDEGRSLVAEADAWMTSQSIRNPERMTAILVAPFPWLQ